MLNQQRLFEQFLSLTGKQVRLGLRSSGERLEGLVQYTMFDSLLLNTGNENRVVAFQDLVFFDEIDQQTT